MQGQPGQAVVAHRVTAEQQAGDLVALEGEDVLTNSALQHLKGTDTEWKHFSTLQETAAARFATNALDFSANKQYKM